MIFSLSWHDVAIDFDISSSQMGMKFGFEVFPAGINRKGYSWFVGGLPALTTLTKMVFQVNFSPSD